MAMRRTRRFRGGPRQRLPRKWLGNNFSGSSLTPVGADATFAGVDFFDTVYQPSDYGQNFAAGLEAEGPLHIGMLGYLIFSTTSVGAAPPATRNLVTSIHWGLILIDDQADLADCPGPADPLAYGTADWLRMGRKDYSFIPTFDVDANHFRQEFGGEYFHGKSIRRLKTHRLVLAVDFATTGAGAGEQYSISVAGYCRALLRGHF